MTGAPLRIEIQLVSDYKQALNVASNITSISLADVEYVCNFMEIGDEGMQVIYDSIGGPGAEVKWIVQDYRNYSPTGAVFYA